MMWAELTEHVQHGAERQHATLQGTHGLVTLVLHHP